MKPNVKFNSRAKNSFVFFQLGLIATMVVTLFVLEFNFKTIKNTSAKITPELYVEKPFQYNPIKLESSPLIESKLVPKSIKLTNVFETVDNTKAVNPLTDVSLVNNISVVDNAIHESNNVINENNNHSASANHNFTEFSVEQMPMFEACIGLSRDKQKECFDNELKKFIGRNISYPSYDFESRNEGTALIEFVIDENGYVKNVKALDNKRATVAMQKSAEKAIKKLPKIIPAKQGNENVRIKYLVPVSFRLK